MKNDERKAAQKGQRQLSESEVFHIFEILGLSTEQERARILEPGNTRSPDKRDAGYITRLSDTSEPPPHCS